MVPWLADLASQKAQAAQLRFLQHYTAGGDDILLNTPSQSTAGISAASAVIVDCLRMTSCWIRSTAGAQPPKDLRGDLSLIPFGDGGDLSPLPTTSHILSRAQEAARCGKHGASGRCIATKYTITA
jgi:hypothetical protein